MVLSMLSFLSVYCIKFISISEIIQSPLGISNVFLNGCCTLALVLGADSVVGEYEFTRLLQCLCILVYSTHTTTEQALGLCEEERR